MRRYRASVLLLALVAPTLGLFGCGSGSGAADMAADSATADGATSSSDALWLLIAQCINVAGEQSCQCPALLATCCNDPDGAYSDAVWSENDDFVAIRDLKQCGCPDDFVHGLAMPRAKITGIEDPNRPDGIWPFAWGTAAARIANPQEIGIAINPPQARSQNQLHLHLVRLSTSARTWFDDPTARQRAAAQYGLVFITLADLDSVFTTVEAQVGDGQIGNTGILVVQASGGGYQALLTDQTSSETYTQAYCN